MEKERIEEKTIQGNREPIIGRSGKVGGKKKSHN